MIEDPDGHLISFAEINQKGTKVRSDWLSWHRLATAEQSAKMDLNTSWFLTGCLYTIFNIIVTTAK
jgi:hypothetical protein